MGDFMVAVLIIVFITSIVMALTKKRRLDGKRLSNLAIKYEDVVVRNSIFNKKIWQGMSRDQLTDSWGKPSGVTQQVLKTKVKETYKYGSNRYGSSVYLENNIVTGWRQPK